MDESLKKQANLRLLQRTFQKNFNDLLETANFVVLYEFQDNAWTKANKEGSMFLVVGTDGQQYITLLNRTSTDNFILPTKNIQFQNQDPYLILKTTTKIYGIWCSSAPERSSFFNKLHNRSISAPPNNAAERALKNVLGISGETPAPATPAPATTASVTPNTAPDTSSSEPLILDKRNLQLALLSLIHDERFLEIVHNQYLRVVRKK